MFSSVNSTDLAALNKEVDVSEVKNSLFDIGGVKAPGYDGFPACLYQNQWSRCASDIFDLVRTAFHSMSLPWGQN